MPPRRSLKPTFAASPLNGGLTRERLLAFSRQRSNTVAGKVTFKVTPASRVVAKARSNAIRSFSEHAASPPSPASSLRPFATKLSSCYYPGGESNKRPYAHSNSCDARIRWNAAPATFAGPSNNDSATDRDVYIKGVSENNRETSSLFSLSYDNIFPGRVNTIDSTTDLRLRDRRQLLSIDSKCSNMIWARNCKINT